jgi:HK97 gp10 family phage protein
MNVDVKVEGLPELEKALNDLGPSLAKKAMVEASKAGGKTFADAAKQKAPRMTKATKHRQPGELADSIVVTTKTNARTGATKAKVGPARPKGGNKQEPGAWGLMEEFGSVHNRPQPYLRPAFDENAEKIIQDFASVLHDAIEKKGK